MSQDLSDWKRTRPVSPVTKMYIYNSAVQCCCLISLYFKNLSLHLYVYCFLLHVCKMLISLPRLNPIKPYTHSLYSSFPHPLLHLTSPNSLHNWTYISLWPRLHIRLQKFLFLFSLLLSYAPTLHFLTMCPPTKPTFNPCFQF